MRPHAEIEVVYDHAVRWMTLVIAVAACRAPSVRDSRAPSATPVRRAAEPPIDAGARIGIVEGRVVDSRSGLGLAAVIVEIDQACLGEKHLRWAITDEHGRYRIESPPGACTVHAHLGAATVEVRVEIVPGRTTSRDLVLEHAAVRAALRSSPPLRCPRSPPGAIVEGHTTPQEELDAVAAVVLERLAIDRDTMGDGALLAPGAIFVASEITARQGRRLSAHAIPATVTQRFVLSPIAALMSEAHRRAHAGSFIMFHVIDTDGTCAIVEAGLRGCTDTDLLENRSGRWTFVRRVRTVCS